MDLQKKTILIEAQRIFRREKHGMDFVALELIRELQKIDTVNNYIIAVGPGEDVCLQETTNFKIEVLPSRNYMIWEQVLLPRLVKKYKADLLHCTSNTAPIWVDVPVVLTLHDIIFMENKMGTNASLYQKLGRIYRRMVVPAILKTVKEVITVSAFEKTNIVTYYPSLGDRVHTVYNGVGTEFKPVEEASDPVLTAMGSGSYWLFLGNTDPKKNMRNTLVAYAQYVEKSAVKRKLLLLDSGSTVIDRLLAELNIEAIKPYIISQGYVGHADLPQWYSYAFGFLYTSLRESFGLPLIEAMACNTPVVASNTSAIPEVAGDAVVYVDPYDPANMAAAMLALEEEALLYADKQRAGLQQSSLYSWTNTGEKTMKVYKQVFES